MKGVIKVFLFLFVFMIIGYQLLANSPPVRHISNEKLNKYLSDKEFDYERNYTVSLTLWDKIKEWFAHLFHVNNHVRVGESNPIVDNILLVLLIGGAIALIVYFLSQGETRGLFSSSKNDKINYAETDENIHEMNFDELINESISKTQYRTAIRYLYLKTLKELSDRNLIKWKPEKTNRDYNIELRSSSFGNLFSQITLLFDYSWYGNADINEGSFSQIKTSFEQFTNQLASK